MPVTVIVADCPATTGLGDTETPNTVDGGRSPTITVTELETPIAPRLSIAFAFTLCVPSGAFDHV